MNKIIKAVWLWVRDWWLALFPSEADMRRRFAGHARPALDAVGKERIQAAVRQLPPEIQCVLIEHVNGASYQQIAAKYDLDEADLREALISAYPRLHAEMDAMSQAGQASPK